MRSTATGTSEENTMRVRRLHTTAILFATFAAVALVTPSRVHAHCDSLDGPVVTSARAALAAGDVALVLHWVHADDEAEIRAAFERTLRVRASAAEARDMADLWFFETLVRVHRAGEGEPYTGLKPAGWQPPSLITAADASLVDGRVDALAARVADHVARELRERHARALSLKDFAPADVEAGRRYVEAYVAYTHYLEALYGLLHGGDGHGAHAGH
jgi:hypothetical protein